METYILTPDAKPLSPQFFPVSGKDNSVHLATQIPKQEASNSPLFKAIHLNSKARKCIISSWQLNNLS